MKYSELPGLGEVGVLDFYNPHDADLSDLRYDSRSVEQGSTFFAIKGFQSDGHRFIEKALKQGATGVVLEDATAFSKDEAKQRGIHWLLVSDARKALALFSEKFYGDPSSQLTLIGVTGTNGKTTVTSIIRQLLAAAGYPAGLIGTVGIWIGDDSIPATHTTPESKDISALLRTMVDHGIRHCAMEVSSHSLALDRVRALKFSTAVFTNLTQDHLDFHHTMEAYFQAKKLLFDRLDDASTAVTNFDSPYGEAIIANTRATAHSFGIADGAWTTDLVATDIEYSLNGTAFTISKRYSDETARISMPLIGSFNVENALAAASALYFGVEGFALARLAELFGQIKPVRGRFESIALKSGAVAIIDYAHTPDALENVLETVRVLQTSNKRLITVFGCGGDRDRSKRPLMGRIASERSDTTIVTSDNPRSEVPGDIIEEILSGIGRRDQVRVIEDRRAAIREALELAREGDCVVIAGKGHETYQIVGMDTLHFDDVEEVQVWNEGN